MDRYIFTFIFGVAILCVYDRFIAHRVRGESQPFGWFTRWRSTVTIAFFGVLVSLFFNTLLGR